MAPDDDGTAAALVGASLRSIPADPVLSLRRRGDIETASLLPRSEDPLRRAATEKMSPSSPPRRPPSARVVVALLLLAAARPARALFEDETGLSDFHLQTAGHGALGVTYASPTSDGRAVITSSSHAYPFVADESGGGGSGSGGGSAAEDDPFGFASSHAPSSSGCYVSARSVEDGKLLWRRDACSSSSSSSSAGVRHAVHTSKAARTVFTLDDAGVFRGWDESTGALKFDVGPGADYAPADGTPRLLGLDLTFKAAVGTVSAASGADADDSEDDEVLLFRDVDTGEPLDGAAVHAAEKLAEARRARPPPRAGSGSVARILGLVEAGGDKAAVLVGWVHRDSHGRSITSGGQMAFVDVELSSYEVGAARPVKLGGEGARLGGGGLRASSLRTFSLGGKAHLMAIAADVEDVITISTDHAGSTTARRTGLTELHPLWQTLSSIHPPASAEGGGNGDAGDAYVRIAGEDDRYPVIRRTVALYHFDPAAGKIGRQLYEGPDYHDGEEESEDDAVVQCADMKLAFEYDGKAEKTTMRAYRIKGEDVVEALGVSGDAAAALPSGGPLRTDHSFVLRCSPSGATILATATGGTTLLLSATFKSDRVAVNLEWSAEEALGAVSSATFLDESHVPVQSADEDEEEALLHGLTFSSRLQSQMESLKTLMTGGVFADLAAALFADGHSESRERSFGFSKVAVLLNSRQNLLLGSDAGSAARGKLRWTRRLHPEAGWHRVVHGGPSSRSGAGGGQDAHALHGHEILALSYVPPRSESGGGDAERRGGAGMLRWTCLDGLTGKVHVRGKIPLGSRVAQIVPLHSAHHVPGECRQVAAVLGEDDSVTVVPDTKHAREVLAETLRTAGGGNGLFAHSLNRATGTFRSLKIESAAAGSKAAPVGETSFRPDRERVVSVSYPRRNEAVQSPAAILGDDSLLLKYLNPHLCVVVTEATPEFLARIDKEGKGGEEGEGEGEGGEGGEEEEEEDGFYRALGAEGKGSTEDPNAGRPRPLGATKPGEESPAAPASAGRAPPPSLFVNVVDSVSARVLHRASHSHVPGHDAAGATGFHATKNVPVLITENWIVYAFPNSRTQRTELGVLTLHEGMIDKNGITAVRSPDQDLAFSALTSARPIVLGKTYGMPGPVSALGITTTRGGISVKHVLLATGPGGNVASVDRRMLDPRRPTGEPKQTEKAEGLVRYSPLIGITTKLMPSYDLEVAGVSSIESAAAQVESQSVALAYGGPDVFAARVSPSGGFDLLPDSFNRPLLSAVVAGLLAVVAALKGMSRRKTAAVGWT